MPGLSFFILNGHWWYGTFQKLSLWSFPKKSNSSAYFFLQPWKEHMHPGILSISEVDSPARVLEYDYGYEKLIERGGSSVNPTLKVASTRSTEPDFFYSFDEGRPYLKYWMNSITPISRKRAALALARTLSPMRKVTLSDSCLALPGSGSQYTGDFVLEFILFHIHRSVEETKEE